MTSQLASAKLALPSSLTDLNMLPGLLRSPSVALRRLGLALAGICLIMGLNPTLISAPAAAQDAGDAADDAPEELPPYTLSELGIRVELPERSWQVAMEDATDLSLRARSRSGVMLLVWATPYQVTISEDNLDGWTEAFQRKAKVEGAGEAEVKERSVVNLRDRDMALHELTVSNSEGGELAMHVYSFSVEGLTAHVATATAAAKGSVAKSELDQVMSDLEFLKDVPELTWGGKVEAEGLDAELDSYWRKPVGRERALVVEEASRLGVSSLRNCWAAIHPHPPGKADVMVACQDVRHVYSIVNERTFPGQELELRTDWIGEDQDPGELVDFIGRSSFWWEAQIGQRELNIAAIPNEKGLVKVVAVSGVGSNAPVATAAKATLDQGLFSEPPPAPFDDLLRYYVLFEPLHPYVIVPVVIALVLFLIILVLIVFGLIKQGQIARAEMEAIQ
ncbi:MAG: hypothetical protein EA397_08685 [Deltaproteobacteria bacterium]|nr:MAG: hypothetical protein EA397_08685 [Deltaproteobacteria bacterium]